MLHSLLSSSLAFLYMADACYSVLAKLEVGGLSFVLAQPWSYINLCTRALGLGASQGPNSFPTMALELLPYIYGGSCVGDSFMPFPYW